MRSWGKKKESSTPKWGNRVVVGVWRICVAHSLDLAFDLGHMIGQNFWKRIRHSSSGPKTRRLVLGLLCCASRPMGVILRRWGFVFFVCVVKFVELLYFSWNDHLHSYRAV